MNLDPIFEGVANTWMGISDFFLVLNYFLQESDSNLPYILLFSLLLCLCLSIRFRGDESFLNEEIYIRKRSAEK